MAPFGTSDPFSPLISGNQKENGEQMLKIEIHV
jgi:hypothetical protein